MTSLVGIDTKDLSQTGWGVIFPAGVDARIKRALAPLLELRRDQVGRSDYYHEFYFSPEQAAEFFLRDLQAGRAAALRPDRVPFYLLIVGSPQEISYEFQVQLGGSLAVGRIDFDHPVDYRNYAENVVSCAGRGRRPREIVFFGVHNQGDLATQRFLNDLTVPLADRIESNHPRYTIRRIFGSDATKDRLIELFQDIDPQPPAVLFASGHGLIWGPQSEQQVRAQGSLLCSDVSGPFDQPQVIPANAYFKPQDLQSESSIRGMIVWHFGAFSAGTPRSRFDAQTTSERIEAAEPFVAELPRQLLSLRGGALAFIGSVGTVWTTSFSWDGEFSQPLAYEQALKLLLHGQPVGAALDPIRELWDYAARRSTELWQKKQLGRSVAESAFVHFQRTNHDAQNWVIFGDPAVTVAARGIT